MTNSGMSFDEFKKLSDDEKQFYTYDKLCNLDRLEDRFAGKWVEVWTIRGLSVVILGILITIIEAVGVHAPSLKVGIHHVINKIQDV